MTAEANQCSEVYPDHDPLCIEENIAQWFPVVRGTLRHHCRSKSAKVAALALVRASKAEREHRFCISYCPLDRSAAAIHVFSLGCGLGLS